MVRVPSLQNKTDSPRLAARRLAATLVLVSSCGFGQLPALASRTPEDVIKAVDRAEDWREQQLKEYMVQERYTLFRRGDSSPAAIIVTKTTYTKGSGKAYQIVTESGSWAGKLVLHKILQSETELSSAENRKTIRITSSNYAMSIDDLTEHAVNGRNCLLLSIVPKRSSPYLLTGKLWVDAKTYHPVRLEGQPSVAASVWTGRPAVERDYTDMDGIPVAIHARSTSKQKLLGDTVLEIDYKDYRLSRTDR